MPRLLALFAVVALLAVPAIPASADTYAGVTLRLNTDGSVNIHTPFVGQTTLTKLSALGTQNLSITQPNVMLSAGLGHDSSPGAWACYLWSNPPLIYPALCTIAGVRTPGGPLIAIMGGVLGGTSVGANEVRLDWDSVPGATGYTVFGTNQQLVSVAPSVPRWWTFINGIACYVVLVSQKGQVQSASDVVCIIPNDMAMNGAAQIGTTMTGFPTVESIPSTVQPPPTSITRPARQAPTPIPRK